MTAVSHININDAVVSDMMGICCCIFTIVGVVNSDDDFSMQTCICIKISQINN